MATLGTGRRRDKRRHAALLLAALAFGAVEADAQTDATANRRKLYAACMEEARQDPPRARERAQAWETTGGGLPARHCLATALIGLKRYPEAAAMMEAIAKEAYGVDLDLGAEVMSQAGQAWSLAGEPARALAAQNEALKRDTDDVELLIDRSISLAALAQFWEAIDDLNRVLDQKPDRADALLLRATAYRHLEVFDMAREDLDRALAAEPGNVDALLELGNLMRDSGDREGARRTWLLGLAHAPEGSAMQTTLQNALQAMDVDPSKPARAARRTERRRDQPQREQPPRDQPQTGVIR
jgi:tetratricopeptide (TPR) repeat protein